MTWKAIADAFFNYLEQGDIFKTAVYAPYSGMLYGIQLFWTIFIVGILTAVWIKTKDVAVTAILASVLFAVLLQKHLVYPPFLKFFYVLLAAAIATALFILLKKKTF